MDGPPPPPLGPGSGPAIGMAGRCVMLCSWLLSQKRIDPDLLLVPRTGLDLFQLGAKLLIE